MSSLALFSPDRYLQEGRLKKEFQGTRSKAEDAITCDTARSFDKIRQDCNTEPLMWTTSRSRQHRCTSVKTNYTCTRVYTFDTTVSQCSLFLFIKQRLTRMEAIVRVGGCFFDHAMRDLVVWETTYKMCFNNFYNFLKRAQYYTFSRNDKINIRE